MNWYRGYKTKTWSKSPDLQNNFCALFYHQLKDSVRENRLNCSFNALGKSFTLGLAFTDLPHHRFAVFKLRVTRSECHSSYTVITSSFQQPQNADRLFEAGFNRVGIDVVTLPSAD